VLRDQQVQFLTECRHGRAILSSGDKQNSHQCVLKCEHFVLTHRVIND
jgi:hypothetical protein